MPWEAIFNYANLYALVCWAVLAFAPKRETLIAPLFYAGVGLLAASYAVLIVGLLSGQIDGGTGSTGASPNFTTLAGVQALFDTQGGASIGWIHYLAFDLFVGIWVARNADRHGYLRIVQIPILFFVLIAGPLGLILYLGLRLTCKGRPENSTVPS